MANWLLARQAQLPLYLLLGTFACTAVWETYLPLRPFTPPLGQRWFHALVLPFLPLRVPVYAGIRLSHSETLP